MNSETIQAREFLAKQFSKDWYTITEKGKQKKYFFEVFLNIKTGEIQIGEKPSIKDLYGCPFDIYVNWKTLTRQLVWNYGAGKVVAMFYKLLDEECDIQDMMRAVEKVDWEKKVKKTTWKKFVGGSCVSNG